MLLVSEFLAFFAVLPYLHLCSVDECWSVLILFFLLTFWKYGIRFLDYPFLVFSQFSFPVLA
ncbi:hypothetical protein BJ508DRAFT_46602 [Ascobolus immersus RN42]|uniref:Uncharacterized protein n=1 Tax=Ascobolus immersus RN42 TaxID=1160509 RepID=A0A3N4IIM0_ASCIM|nr:hypothetical protein BJ508DRAFT_46602 [Ascobolus immersus RN42]